MNRKFLSSCRLFTSVVFAVVAFAACSGTEAPSSKPAPDVATANSAPGVATDASAPDAQPASTPQLPESAPVDVALPAQDAAAPTPPVPPPPPAVTGLPMWSLVDIQPKSGALYNKPYSLEAFRGRPIFVALLAGNCGYCMIRLAKLNELHQQLVDANVDVAFVVLHDRFANQNWSQSNLVGRTVFPVFQDTFEVNAYAQLGAEKDEIVLFDAKGNLFRKFRRVDGTLTSDVDPYFGLANLKNIVSELVKAGQ